MAEHDRTARRGPVSPAPEGGPFAHSPSAVSGRWHTLEDHHRGTAELARRFAEPFGGGPLAGLVGAVHDTGKASCAWQDGLARAAATGEPVGVGHRHAGALLTYQQVPDLPFAALVPLGHHGGLSDWSEVVGLLRRLRKAADALPGGQSVDAAPARVPGDLDPDVAATIAFTRTCLPNLLTVAPQLPEWVSAGCAAVVRSVSAGATRGALVDPHAQHRLELWLRMCFSALVDADFLDTEAHFSGAAEPRAGRATSPAVLMERFMAGRTAMFAGRPRGPAGEAREALYAEVVARAGSARGLFRLAAPTGSGKTLTAMGFALAHAATHGLRRVVIAAPFITVTEQNAAVYRELLDPHGLGDVLEHHSALDDAADSRQRRELVANWDAPIVITTTVQLLESLHDRSPRACRKLHRLAGSVIVLDEVQALPHHLLPTILRTLRLLVEDYGASVVFTTATQPALWDFPDSPFAEVPVTDLVAAPAALYRSLARVHFDWRRYPRTLGGAADWSAVAVDVVDGAEGAGGSGLLIASTTADAAAAFTEIAALARSRGEPRPMLRHLSTRMTRANRSRVLGEVRAALGAGRPLLLTSTQVVEAGVDLDFPFLARVCGPAEALVQAAGRCNREGRRPALDSRVLVASVDGAGTPGPLYAGAGDICQAWFAPWTPRPGGPRELEDPDAVRDYFADVYSSHKPGTSRAATTLALSRPLLQYEQTATAFRMIEQTGAAVLVPPGAGAGTAGGAPSPAAPGGAAEQGRLVVEAPGDGPASPTGAPFDTLVDALRAGRRLRPDQVRLLTEQTATVSRTMATRAYTAGLTEQLLLWTGPYDTDLGCVSDAPADDVIW